MGFLNGSKLIVGYDMGNQYCQISYALSAGGNVETISQVAGSEAYNIPAVLCKRIGTNQWHYGREALRQASEQEGILVENLWELALDGELVVIEGESYDPVSLLALFFKKSLGLLAQVGQPDKFAALMITCPVLDRRTLEVLYDMVDSIHLKRDRVMFQSHGESYYSYMLRQPEELWVYMSVLFDYRGDTIRVYRMECNRRTVPIAVFIETKEYEAFPGEDVCDARERDRAFGQIVEKECKDGRIRSIYLVGDGFAGDWMSGSLRSLCQGRRVFQGNNLFGKGACCGMQERLEPCEAGKNHVFLGKDKLKSNIGMEVLHRGENTYCLLLGAGVNWYEARQTADFYIQEGNELTLTVNPLMGKDVRQEKILLENFPGTIARLRIHLFLEEEDCLVVEVEDLGFGELRTSSGRVWKRIIRI